MKLTKIIPKKYIPPLAFVLIWNSIVYYGSRAIMANAPHISMELPIDRAIPFIPWTIVIYVGCYAFWVINYILACRYDSDTAWVTLSTDFLAKAVCFVFFILLPTTIARPEVTGNGFWELCVRFIYFKDSPDNLFPSIHCLCSWVSFIAVRSNKEIPLWYRVFSLAFALAVCVVTLTTKQHVIVDTVAGLVLAEGCCQFTRVTGFYKKYGKVFAAFTKTVEKV